MRDPLSEKCVALKPSGIRKFFDIVAEMKDAISLGVGEPDFDTPWHIRDEGIYSLEKGRTFYTSNAGLMELRQEICRYLDRRFDCKYDPRTETLITVGGSEGIDMALRAMVNPGDEVIIPQPSYVSYEPCAILADAKPVIINLKNENEFRLTAQELEEAITDTLPGMKERTILINGFSKSYAMTGWRLGYACGPANIIAQMTKIHQFAIMCAPTTSQYAAIEALKNGDDDVREMAEAYDQRRRFLMSEFEKIGLPCFEPYGAFYVFPCIKEFGMTSEEFATKLLEEEKVAVVPGTAFGDCGEGFLRISYAYSIENLKVALDRIGDFVARLRERA